MSPNGSEKESMSGIVKVVAVVVVVCLGLWGCARTPGRQGASNDRVRALEGRCQKLEQERQAMAEARDRARKELKDLADEAMQMQKLAALNTSLVQEADRLRLQVKAGLSVRDQMQRQLAERTSERDDLRLQMSQQTHDREMLLNRCEKMRRSLQQILTQDDAPGAPAMAPSEPTSGPAINTPS